MTKELSKHASVVMYLGIRYEDILATRFRAKGIGLGERVISAGKTIPKDLVYRLMRFNYLRNSCAHDIGFKRLQNLSEAIVMFNQIEDGFAALIPQWTPDYLTESDFEQHSTSSTDVLVSMPSTKTVYIQHFVIPLAIKVGLSLLTVGLVLVIVFGATYKSTTDYSTGGVFGIGSKQHEDVYDAPTGALWFVVVAAIVAVAGWGWYYLQRKLKAKFSTR